MRRFAIGELRCPYFQDVQDSCIQWYETPGAGLGFGLSNRKHLAREVQLLPLQQSNFAVPHSSIQGQHDSRVEQLNGVLPAVTQGLNFEGQGAQDTRNIFGFAFVPPDTNGAAGANQYVQIVNITIAVYDKSTGARVMGPAAIHTLWTGFGGPCEIDTWGGRSFFP